MSKVSHGLKHKSRGFIFIFLCVACNAFCQEISTVQQQFEAYQGANFQEKVFLHTDKSVYTSGEILWFRAYVANAGNNSLSILSSICYVEILGADNKPLLQAKIDIDSGKGSGSFLLPSFLRTGNYVLRAYTNWMKNFEPSFYFEQPLTIINVNKKAQATDNATKNTYSVQFFPEGGNLVSGLVNNVAVKITDRYGKAAKGKGIIINGRNETIVQFETEHLGMGTFTFTPAKGDKYHAEIQLDDKTISEELPQIYTNGWVLQVKDQGSSLQVNISTNVETGQAVFLFAHTRGVVKFAKMQPLNNGGVTFIISKSALGEGISHLTVFNEQKQPVCERLYFKKPVEVLQVNIDGAQPTYHPRQKVNISVSAKDFNVTGANADMSVAVYLTDSLQPMQQANLLNYLWLSSEVRGNIESPGYYFENSGPDVDKAVDNLMLTQGWRRFKWENVLSNALPAFTFLPEGEGHIITGRITPKVAGLTNGGINGWLSVKGKNYKLANSTSSATGVIKFNVEKFYGIHEILTQTNLADSNYRIFIDNPFSDKFAGNRMESFNAGNKFSSLVLVRSMGAQVQDSYEHEKRQTFILPGSYDSTGSFGLPTKTYLLDDYTRFPTMEEVMREYVREVHVKNRQKKFYYEVFNEPAKDYFTEDPLVLIDGTIVSDINKIIDTDPLKIKRIDVSTNRLYQGNQKYDGIVSYSTYNDDLEGYQIDPNAVVVEYEGLQLQREFYSPQYETAKQQLSRIPDFRNVLYWSPNFKTANGKNDFSFYTSDIAGTYTIVVQGFSTTGLAGFKSTTFTVTDPSK